jgi:hypothetical protein
MFARVLYYRRPIKAGECQVNDPSQSNQKMRRSSLQDLIDGVCPDLGKQVQGIVALPTLDPKDVGTGTSGRNEGGASATPKAPGAENAAERKAAPALRKFAVAVGVLALTISFL